MTTDLTSTTLPQDLDQLLRDNHKWVHRTAYGVTRQLEDAEDVAQSLFLVCFNAAFLPTLEEMPGAICIAPSSIWPGIECVHSAGKL